MSIPRSCDDQQLLAMLSSDSEAEHFPQVLKHVEHCSRCQLQLENLAADSQQWCQAAQVLSDFSSSDDFRNQALTASFRRRTSDQPLEWTEAMARQLLSPGSHPGVLGRIGRYDVERLIGSGGMGIVFKAFDTELNRPVAIKILAPYLAGSGAARQRFAREAKAAAAVVHEHVVPIHNVETDGQSPFLVMRYVGGESLQARIDRLGALDVCEVLRIAMQSASGLAAAHAHGLIHRDIKPANILVESSVERSLITDFGLARAADDASLTNTGYHPGTPQFMSPEQARGDNIDSRSDLFSLGSVMYTMAAGRPPFRAETSYGILRRITDSHPRHIQEINPEIPSWLCEVINKLMAKSASDRFQSAAELAEVLALCLAHVQRPATCRLPAEVIKLDKLATNSRLVARLKTIATWTLAPVALLAFAWFATPVLLAPWFNRNPQHQRDSNETNAAISQAEQNNELVKPVDDSVNTSESTATLPKRQPLVRGPKQLAKPEPSEVLRHKFGIPTTIKLENVSLDEGVAAILQSSQIEFSINSVSFEADDKNRLQTRSLVGSGTTYSMLKRFLDSFGASYIVHDFELDIVPLDYAQQNPVLRYYEMSLIQSGNQNIPAIVTAIESCTSPSLWHSSGGAFTISTLDSELVIKADEITHHEIERLLSAIGNYR